eukprot:COSAG04_NODE_613_length_11957_cov_9.925620_2_plen_88_part_01
MSGTPPHPTHPHSTRTPPRPTARLLQSRRRPRPHAWRQEFKTTTRTSTVLGTKHEGVLKVGPIKRGGGESAIELPGYQLQYPYSYVE